MQTLALPESITLSDKLTTFEAECWPDDACVLDTDYFVKALSGIQGKGVGPDLIGSIITHYASKWLPDLDGDEAERASTSFLDSPESITASWMKKRLFIEALVGILPLDKNSIPCDFLLRLLRVANMVGVEAGCRAELEKRISWQLDQASLKELMIPSFSHICTTLLDFQLVLRLVRNFVTLEEVSRSGAALMKVAKLVDFYLAEAAVDSHLTLPEFVALASALPSHARSSDDGLYRAIDTYLKSQTRDSSDEESRRLVFQGNALYTTHTFHPDKKKAHPGLSKQERKRLCILIDSRKLSAEASLHAAQNERLPVRAVIQVLLSEQDKLSKHIDWSGSLSLTGARSPGFGLDATARCLSKREMITQQMEIKRLKEDVLMLRSQCMNMERQIEKLLEKKKGYFSWKKLGIPVFKANKIGGVEGETGEAAVGLKTPLEMKARPVGCKSSNKWKESLY